MDQAPAMVGKAAVVVGGSRGIGEAVARLLAEHGASVVVNGRALDAAESVAASINSDGGCAIAFAGSPAAAGTAEELIAACVDEFGCIDVLINCAGIAEPAKSSILDISTDDWRELIDVHLTTVFNSCRFAARRMVANGGGAIVNTSSFAFLGNYGGTGYPAGKGAVNSLTMAIAAELKEGGVRANVVCPGARTRLSTGPEYEDQIRNLHRRGLLDEVTMTASLDPAPSGYAAPAYVYLASDLAAAVTGGIFVAAGNFLGRFRRQTPSVLGYRDHTDSPPWSIAEVAGLVSG